MQGDTDWLQERCGIITASRFRDVLSVSKRDGKPLKARQDYASELMVERLTGTPSSSPFNYAMQWGTDCEPAARLAYEINTGIAIKEVGFIQNAIAGASPDGLIGTDGGAEIKCPANSVNHVITLLEGMPDYHNAQVQGQMWVAELQWVDFVSFDPRMPEHLQLYVQRIERDEGFIEHMKAQIITFDEEIRALIARLPEAA